MKHYLLTLKQISTGYVRHRRVYWNREQYNHYSNRLHEPIAGLIILSIEPEQ